MKKHLRKSVAGLLFCIFAFMLIPGQTAFAKTKVTYISSVSALKKMAKNPAGHYKLKKDLNLKGKTWTSIGTTDQPFTGVFDGGGHTIKNLSIPQEGDYHGLFGYIKGGTIKNLTITGKIKGGTYVGAFAGQIEDGQIVNCVNKAKIYGVNQVGGLVGRISRSTVLNCQNNAKVTGTGRCTGGITSDLYPSGYVFNCVNLGTVTGGYDLNGGITGGSTSGEVANCVNFANVTGRGRCGAIAGDNASYAGSRYYNYFRKTASINPNYSPVGSNSRTFVKAKKSLSESVELNGKTYKKVLNALNAGRILLKKDTGKAARKWKIINSKPVLFK